MNKKQYWLNSVESAESCVEELYNEVCKLKKKFEKLKARELPEDKFAYLSVGLSCLRNSARSMHGKMRFLTALAELLENGG
ncbi:MAG: hypothetical protein QXT14_03065 [Candidatus Bathyarchaeia archaeon]